MRNATLLMIWCASMSVLSYPLQISMPSWTSSTSTLQMGSWLVTPSGALLTSPYSPQTMSTNAPASFRPRVRMFGVSSGNSWALIGLLATTASTTIYIVYTNASNSTTSSEPHGSEILLTFLAGKWCRQPRFVWPWGYGSLSQA